MNAYGQGTFAYAYDAAGRQIRITTPQMLTTSLAYDPLARVFARGSRRVKQGRVDEQNRATHDVERYPAPPAHPLAVALGIGLVG